MPKRRLGQRWRYIAFSIGYDSTVERGDFLNALMVASRGTRLGGAFRITVFEGNFGILKVPHTMKEDAIAVLRSVNNIGGAECSVETLRTSGTIKTLKERYRERLGKSVNERE